MKKILFALLSCITLALPASGATTATLALNADGLNMVLKQHFSAEEQRKLMLQKYRDLLAENGGAGVDIRKLWSVCSAGGLDISSDGGKAQCQKFVNDALKTNVFYYVCEDSVKLPAGGVKRCDETFDPGWGDSDVQVTVHQAINLAKVLATKKYKDDIYCSNHTKGSSNDDFIACKSSKNQNIFYSFRFPDLEDNDDDDIATGVQSGICMIMNLEHDTLAGVSAHKYNMLSGTVLGTWEQGYRPDTSLVTMPYCKTTSKHFCEGDLNNVANGFGYKMVYDSGDKCVFAKRFKSANDIRNEYGAPINNLIFSEGDAQIQLYANGTLEDTIKKYVIAQIGADTLKSFKCDKTHHLLRRSWRQDDEDVLTCYINEKQVDFVFDDLTQTQSTYFGRELTKGSKQALECIVAGGTYNGKSCMHLGQAQCEQLKKFSQDSCPECESVEWNKETEMCELPSAAKAQNIQKGLVVTAIVAGAVITAVITVTTAGTGTAAMTIGIIELSGSAIELGAQLEIYEAADNFFIESSKCKDENCAQKLIGENLQRFANLNRDLTQPERTGIDKEMARLLNIIPDDSEFYQKIIENGITISENEKGMFDPESWEPEQVWRAVGITLQLASLFTAVGQWIKTGGKKVVTQLDEANDVMRIKLTRAQAKNLDDMTDMMTRLDDLRQAGSLKKSRADKLWAHYKGVTNKRAHLLNQLGNPADDILPFLKKEAYLVDDLAKYNDELAKVISQQDHLYTINKNGQKVLAQGKTKFDVTSLMRQYDDISSKIDDVAKQLDDVSKHIDTYYGARGATTKVVETVTPATALFDDGLTATSRLEKGLLQVAKDQTRNWYDDAAIVATATGAALANDTTPNNTPDNTTTPGGETNPPKDDNPGGGNASGGSEVFLEGPVLDEVVVPGEAKKREIEGLKIGDTTPKMPTFTATPPAKKPSESTTPVVTPTVTPEPETPAPVVTPTVPIAPVSVAPIEPLKNVEPVKTEKKRNTAAIAIGSVLAVGATGGLVGGLVAKNKRDERREANKLTTVPVATQFVGAGNQLTNEMNALLGTAGSILGYVNGKELKLIPLPTVVNTYSTIVQINVRAVAVVDYNGYKLPYYVEPTAGSWRPLLGIGQMGGWFNTYPSDTGITTIDSITNTLNQILAPANVSKFVGGAAGASFPVAAPAAYQIINAEFPNGVVQTYNGTFTPADQALYNSNYNKMKNAL